MGLRFYQHLQAGRRQRTPGSKDYRKGYHKREWGTRVGRIDLKVSRARDHRYYVRSSVGTFVGTPYTHRASPSIERFDKSHIFQRRDARWCSVLYAVLELQNLYAPVRLRPPPPI